MAGRRQSSNVNDMRAAALPAGAGGDRRRLGLVVALILFLITGNPSTLTDVLDNQGVVSFPASEQQEQYQASDREQQLYEYAGVVMADIEDTWNTLLPQEGKSMWSPPHHLFGAVQSGCGTASSALGLSIAPETIRSIWI